MVLNLLNSLRHLALPRYEAWPLTKPTTRKVWDPPARRVAARLGWSRWRARRHSPQQLGGLIASAKGANAGHQADCAVGIEYWACYFW